MREVLRDRVQTLTVFTVLFPHPFPNIISQDNVILHTGSQ